MYVCVCVYSVGMAKWLAGHTKDYTIIKMVQTASPFGTQCVLGRPGGLAVQVDRFLGRVVCETVYWDIHLK